MPFSQTRPFLIRVLAVMALLVVLMTPADRVHAQASVSVKLSPELLAPSGAAPWRKLLSGQAHVKVLILANSADPELTALRREILRQGGSAKGWILMEEVRLGYEIWRILNGFPPRIPNPDAIFGDGSATSKAGP